MAIRGIRGAVRVRSNTRKDIFDGTRRLMGAVLRANRVRPEDVASCFFTMTPDLNADFPAYAVRGLEGWKHVPLLCAGELAVPDSMTRVVRVLLLVETDVPPGKIRHQYLGETSCLRPDLARTNSRRRRK